jgi:biopolymer transport protein ExbD
MVGGSLQPRQPHSYNRSCSYDQPDSSVESPKDDEDYESSQKVPVHDQRTVLITNLSERTTHKDLASIVRGGRLLDIFLRNDRTATISFVEGAADFLAYAKRKDIYLHTKRVSSILR